MKDKNIERMREASGKFESDDILTDFFYVLLRNGCPIGVIEEALEEASDKPTVFTNGWLGEYAQYIAKRFREQFESSF